MQRAEYSLAMRMAAGVLALALVAGCGRKEREVPEPEASSTDGPRSIFQPEFQVEDTPQPTVLAPLETVITFPEGTDLSETALAELATVLGSPQVEKGLPIVLRGHSDAGGSDEVNMRMSRERAEAVRDWMVENGVAEDRITVIAFGEQNPLEPNALPDGSPNEEGRAANRRVAITVREGGARDAVEEPTLIEELTSPTPAPSEGAE